MQNKKCLSCFYKNYKLARDKNFIKANSLSMSVNVVRRGNKFYKEFNVLLRKFFILIFICVYLILYLICISICF